MVLGVWRKQSLHEIFSFLSMISTWQCVILLECFICLIACSVGMTRLR